MYINEKHKRIVENRGYGYIGSYRTKEVTLDNKNKKGTDIYIRVKCPYCNSEYDVHLSGFKKGNNCGKCCNKYENSFAYYIQQELQEPLNKYWDWDKNTVNPYCIYKSSHKKIWIKCDKAKYHESYEVSCHNFKNNNRCPYCYRKKVHPKDSFAQYHIDNTDKDFLEKYRSDKNTLNPRELPLYSHKTVWIKCQNKDYHEDYQVVCYEFSKGSRCPYCINHKIHIKDSFGALYPEKAKYRSKRNKESPYEVAPKTSKKYRFYCEDCGKEFEKKLNHLNIRGDNLKCPNCTSSKGEQRISNFLIKNNIKFETQKEFHGLVGINGGNLSYDFYLPQHNLLIEYQGEFHDGTAWQQKTTNFERQKEHDRRKRNYVKEHNIDLLEIWYWDFDNIENILFEIILNNKGGIIQ